MRYRNGLKSTIARDQSNLLELDSYIDDALESYLLEEGEDSDYVAGEPTSTTTSEIAGRIAAAQRILSGRQVYQEVVFPVGVPPRQGIDTNDGSLALIRSVGRRTTIRANIRPDVSFVGTDNRLINLEVDNTENGMRNHICNHAQAIAKSVLNARNIRLGRGFNENNVLSNRSVFILVDRRGTRVRQITKVGYFLSPRNRNLILSVTQRIPPPGTGTIGQLLSNPFQQQLALPLRGQVIPSYSVTIPTQRSASSACISQLTLPGIPDNPPRPPRPPRTPRRQR